MRILYALQGTGNGHLSRAQALLPFLDALGQLDVLVSGRETQLSLDQRNVSQISGVIMKYDKKGGVSFLRTLVRNNPIRILREIRNVNVRDYQLVLNDFESVTARACKWYNVPIIGLSHQAALLKPGIPQPLKKPLPGLITLKNYASVEPSLGFHFKPYAPDIFYPVLRDQVRHASGIEDRGHVTVYLPAMGIRALTNVLESIRDLPFHIFTRDVSEHQQVGHLHFFPIRSGKFLEDLVQCHGVITSAGFETPSEALALGKKLLSVPIKNQTEQYYNAAALEDLGVHTCPPGTLTSARILEWLENAGKVEYHWQDPIQEVVQRIKKVARTQFNIALT